jgi:hypothetical protein
MGRTLRLGLGLRPFGADSHTRFWHRAMPRVDAHRPLAFSDANIRPLYERDDLHDLSPNGAMSTNIAHSAMNMATTRTSPNGAQAQARGETPGQRGDEHEHRATPFE